MTKMIYLFVNSASLACNRANLRKHLTCLLVSLSSTSRLAHRRALTSSYQKNVLQLYIWPEFNIIN